jgi:hypothetical protein
VLESIAQVDGSVVLDRNGTLRLEFLHFLAFVGQVGNH